MTMGEYEAPAIEDLGSVRDLTEAFGQADDQDLIYDAGGNLIGTGFGSRDGDDTVPATP